MNIIGNLDRCEFLQKKFLQLFCIEATLKECEDFWVWYSSEIYDDWGWADIPLENDDYEWRRIKQYLDDYMEMQEE